MKNVFETHPLPLQHPHSVLMLCLRCSLCSCCEWITWYPVFPSLDPTCWPVWRVVCVDRQATASQRWRFRMLKLLRGPCFTVFSGARFLWWRLLSCDVDHCRRPRPLTPHTPTQRPPRRNMLCSFGEVCFCRILGVLKENHLSRQHLTLSVLTSVD